MYRCPSVFGSDAKPNRPSSEPRLFTRPVMSMASVTVASSSSGSSNTQTLPACSVIHT